MCAKYFLVSVVVALGVLGLGLSPAFADLVAGDSFDYPTGNLSGNNGGAGWSGAWAIHQGYGDQPVVSPGLSYGGVGSEGNAVDTSVYDGRLIRTFGSPIGGTDGSVWLGFLAKGNSAADATKRWSNFALYNGDTTEGAYFGKGNLVGYWGMGGGTNVKLSTAPTTSTDTVFMVARIDFNTAGNDTYTAWVNPSPSVTPVDGDAYGSFALPHSTFDRVRLAGRVAVHFDEFRMGTEYTNLIPEPSAMVLSITGLIGLLAYAWRKRK